jgi:hypothetical protein
MLAWPRINVRFRGLSGYYKVRAAMMHPPVEDVDTGVARSSVILSPCLLEHLPCSDQLESFYRSLSEQIASRVAFPLGGLTQARRHLTRY